MHHRTLQRVLGFEEVPTLTKISISQNKLSEMPSLIDLPGLEELDTQDNRLQGNITIQGMPKLIRLGLASNNLTDVNLVDLPRLVQLDLSSNQLQGNLDMKAFSHFTEWAWCMVLTHVWQNV